MTVKELIKELQKVENQDARVITKDYGGAGFGFLDTGSIQLIKEVLDAISSEGAK